MKPFAAYVYVHVYVLPIILSAMLLCSDSITSL